MNVNHDLISVLEAKKEYVEQQETLSCYLSIYQVERCYGGPEEGGWWYDCWTLQGYIPCANEAEANKVIEESQEELKQKNHELRYEDNKYAYEALGDNDTVSSSYPEGYIPKGWSDGGEYQLIVEFVLGSQDTSARGRPHYE